MLPLLLHSNPFFHLAPFILSPSCPKEILRYSLLQIHISILFQGIKMYIHFVSFNFCSPTSSNIFLSLPLFFFFSPHHNSGSLFTCLLFSLSSLFPPSCLQLVSSFYLDLLSATILYPVSSFTHLFSVTLLQFDMAMCCRWHRELM